MEIYFDGYCPESLLKGNQVEMRLNEDDFWESEATGLQICISQPYATILRWRGKRKFRQSSDIASNSLSGLIMTEANKEDGKEIFPDEQNIIGNNFDLEWYIDGIYKTKEEFDAKKFNPNDPIFKLQEEYLNTIPKSKLEELVQLYDSAKEQYTGDSIFNNESFKALHEKLYELKIVFDFKWMVWYNGWKNINDTNYNYSDCSILDFSMYITSIFREDRFNDGTIKLNFKNGTLEKLFNIVRN